MHTIKKLIKKKIALKIFKIFSLENFGQNYLVKEFSLGDLSRHSGIVWNIYH